MGPRKVTGRTVTAVALLLLGVIGTGCASSGAVPRPRPFPGAALPPGPTPPNGEDGKTADGVVPEAPAIPALPPVGPSAPQPRVVALALSLRGTPYRNGGSDPSGFDCSGFVQWVFARSGTALPREVRDQYRAGEDVDDEEVMPGDLVFFETVAEGASHVGIAIGGGEFVHAPSSRGVVRVERYTSEYWSKRWIGARRATATRESD